MSSSTVERVRAASRTGRLHLDVVPARRRSAVDDPLDAACARGGRDALAGKRAAQDGLRPRLPEQQVGPSRAGRPAARPEHELLALRELRRGRRRSGRPSSRAWRGSSCARRRPCAPAGRRRRSSRSRSGGGSGAGASAATAFATSSRPQPLSGSRPSAAARAAGRRRSRRRRCARGSPPPGRSSATAGARGAPRPRRRPAARRTTSPPGAVVVGAAVGVALRRAQPGALGGQRRRERREDADAGRREVVVDRVAVREVGDVARSRSSAPTPITCGSAAG